MKKQNKNKGFTLVELLVAMTILSIIVVPLLQMFVGAVRTNAKARTVMQATTLAQDTMENIKAYSLEDIARDFNGYRVAGYDTKGDVVLVKSNMANNESFEAKAFEGTYTAVVKSEDKEYNPLLNTPNSSVIAKYDPTNGVHKVGNNIDHIDFTSTSFVGNTDNNYYFVMPNVKSGTGFFDVLINVFAKSEQAIANIMDMNQPDCGYYVQNNDQNDGAIAEQFYSRYQAYMNTINKPETLVKGDFNTIISKKVTIDINKSNLNETIASVNYRYDCGVGYVAAEDRYIETNTTIFNNVVSEKKLKALYIYYYPLYNTSGSSARDTFVINNNTGEDVVVYLISMSGSSTTTTKENDYLAKVELNDKTIIGTNSSRILTTVCSNVKDRFKDITDNVPGETLVINDLGNAQSLNVKYNVTVTVYKHDEDAFSGGRQKMFVPSDKSRVLTFTGSTLDNSTISE